MCNVFMRISYCPILIQKYFVKNLYNSSIRRYSLNLSKMDEIVPPVEVRGMKVLNRQQFSIKKSVPTLRIVADNLNTSLTAIKKYLLKLDKWKPVQPLDESYKTKHRIDDEKEKFRVAYLNPSCVKRWSDFNNETKSALEKSGVTESDFVYHEIFITYDNWKFDEIIKAILPVDKEAATSYTLIGHIAHINLREHNLEYKNVIGQVMLDKIKNCKTVVNKTDEINSTYRNFKMEILCGENNFITYVKENGCVFDMDFSQVYWNSRLATEHERIVKLLSKGDILFDVFAGIGPFSLPIAKKKCWVLANDLNPESYKWLAHNAKKNKISNDYFKAYNMDGAEFIEKVFRDFLIELIEMNSIHFDFDNILHITMNLPAIAVTFLKCFVGLLKNCEVNQEKLSKLKIIVHVYCFVKGEPQEKYAKETVEQNLGFELDENHINNIFFVRTVAPNKDMMRVSFYLHSDILLGNVQLSVKKRKSDTVEESEPENKRLIS